MKHIPRSLALAAFSLFSHTAFAASFGSREVAQEVSLAEALANPARYSGRLVRISGTVSDVCQKKGCWMVLGSGASTVRVRFGNHDFFVPTDSSGKAAVVEGRLRTVELSEEQYQHLAGEAVDRESIQRKSVELNASGVRLENAPKGRKSRRGKSGG